MTTRTLPADYAERVYAGVLGKMIGVYLGRPFEQWTHQRIMRELGEIRYYVNDRLGKPLIVTDDDLTGTFTFLRALEDYGYSADLTPAQIGQSWLNYIIEGKTILWWGGLGYSTEHTAYLRLKRGTTAPASGSIALNGKILAEQIGSQIFIDGWAMVAPNDPALAADLAGRAGSVSHDGESVYAAQLWAAMEAAAFSEGNIQRLLDTGLSFIPADSIISRVIAQLRELRQAEADWYAARDWLEATHGYDKYSGACHVVPNHALMILSLLYGDDDFQKTQLIVNTSGWDTDCNAGNLGCLLGIKNGLTGLECGPDWRSPLADRLYLPTADGGRAITDAVQESYHVINAGRALTGLPPAKPKNGARFHFEFPGAVQGFRIDVLSALQAAVRLENVEGHSEGGSRSLALRFDHLAAPHTIRLATPTFIPPDARTMPGSYALLASPTLYSGQEVRARVSADQSNGKAVALRMFISVYGAGDQLVKLYDGAHILAAGGAATLQWTVPDTQGQPISEIGLELSSDQRVGGAIYLDYLTWQGEPTVTLQRGEGTMWQRAWVEGIFRLRATTTTPFHIVHNEGVGLLIQGTREWMNYQVSAAVTPHLCKSAGIAARVQGMRRYYALLLRENGAGTSAGTSTGTVALVKALDGTVTLAEIPFAWQFDTTYQLTLRVNGEQVIGLVDDRALFDVRDEINPLRSGAIALLCEEGCLSSGDVAIQPVPSLV